ncbi:hypothetical protein OSTOST_11884 [Ostertagia ostertagi]
MRVKPTATTVTKSDAAVIKVTWLCSAVLMAPAETEVPEPAITTAILTVFIDNHSSFTLVLEKPSKLAVVEKTPSKPKWETKDAREGAFEVISTLIKPLLLNVPNRLSNYLSEPTPQSTVRQRLDDLVYPVVLELLQDLGEFARRERRKNRLSQSEPPMKPLSGCIANDVTELILIRLSEKLRQEYGTFNETLNLN